MDTFWGLSSTGWTAIGSIITALGITTAHMLPIFKRIYIKRKIIKVVCSELAFNEQCFRFGCETNFSPLEHFKYLGMKEWEKYQSQAIELFNTKVYIHTNSYYTAISRFYNRVEEAIKVKSPNNREEVSSLVGIAKLYISFSNITNERVKKQKYIVRKTSIQE